MASEEELKKALRDTLEKKGVLGRIQAEVRAEVFNLLEEPPMSRPHVPFAMSRQNLVLNQLVMEYLQWNGYNWAASVLKAESGHMSDLDRRLLANEVGIRDPAAIADRAPLLYSMLTAMKDHDSKPSVHSLQMTHDE